MTSQEVDITGRQRNKNKKDCLNGRQPHKIQLDLKFCWTQKLSGPNKFVDPEIVNTQYFVNQKLL